LYQGIGVLKLGPRFSLLQLSFVSRYRCLRIRI